MLGFTERWNGCTKRGWKVKILSWRHSCNQRMRRWAEENGMFVALDDFYEAITFLEPSPKLGYAMSRRQGAVEPLAAADGVNLKGWLLLPGLLRGNEHSAIVRAMKAPVERHLLRWR